jgi:ribose 5-phosphate isomerase B
MTTSRTIALASDHAAIGLKAELAAWLVEQGHAVTDLGPDTADSVDYPDYGFKLADHVASGAAEFGVALCGSGIGISIAVNRNSGCRCALVSDHLAASLSRQHNNANVIAMGARLIGVDTAKDCLATFVATPFEGGRHERRVAKLTPA